MSTDPHALKSRHAGASGNSIGWVAAGTAAVAVGTSAVTGSGLLPALVITSAVTGSFVSYQYFTKTGIFLPPEKPSQPPLSGVSSAYHTPSQQVDIEVPKTPIIKNNGRTLT